MGNALVTLLPAYKGLTHEPPSTNPPQDPEIPNEASEGLHQAYVKPQHLAYKPMIGEP